MAPTHVQEDSSARTAAAPALAFRALLLRLLFALMGVFAGATLCWIGWGVMTPGDSFANGSSFVYLTLLVLGLLGGYAAFKSRSRRARIGVILATGLCATFWLAAPDAWWAKPPPQRPLSELTAAPTAEDLREAERETQLKFPASSRVLVWDARRGKDPSLQMKFEMAAADWPAFIAASPFRDKPLREGGGANLGVDHGPWTPYKVEHLLVGEYRLPDVLDLNLGADLSQRDVVIVYLVWHET